jgi:hypothetical protein
MPTIFVSPVCARPLSPLPCLRLNAAQADVREQSTRGSTNDDDEHDGSRARKSRRDDKSQPDYDSMRPFQLKDECAKRGLSRDGGRDELVQRLRDDDRAHSR